ncbi:HNH endonuclease family protein [Acinetobacter rathckeae]|uniref:HNH endonuclease domain-containing protein n=1 Tax=Acinetobacter rathckeae TaxID=2605272 RepID=UPI0018A30FCB|nr:HNH endonuclease domain-containing protein [Acinetobacter rathckeae]MBF7688271.1 HNH endonuclease [Acinetobacter rathckeae]MBF7695211.1 HNH endonuclease [Acinetobacter rathckeae]
MSEFYEIQPSKENYWRSIILFGRNVASYKFALAKALYDVKTAGHTVVTLDQLAVPFSRYICEHLQLVDKQATSQSSKFLDFCRAYNRNEIDQTMLINKTVRYGFVNVIDAFHCVHGQEIPQRFFSDARKTHQGIILTDEIFQLFDGEQSKDLIEETEARWRLVETAWDMNLPKHLVQIQHDEQGILVADNKIRRVNVTSVKSALNGYQKSKCFYCFTDITITQFLPNSADVDHFFPHKLRYCDAQKPVNGVANLVLACTECNRGQNGKFDRLPSVSLLAQLHKRNEYLITSHHPLRETLIAQTGFTEIARRGFLQSAYDCATHHLGMAYKWQPKQNGHSAF